jgi:hypothetical protein
MRLLLPAPGFPPLFYEINISEEPASLAITGFDHRHRVVAEADMRPEGEFGLISTQILGENAVTVRATLSQTGGGLAAIKGTISEQPFKFVNTPSHKPQVLQAPSLSDDPWSTSPCQLVLGAIAVGASSFLTAITDAAALDAYQNAIRAADAWLVQGNCIQRVPPLSDVEPS